MYEGLIVYFGLVIEGDEYCWMDVYYNFVNKGSVVEFLC